MWCWGEGTMSCATCFQKAFLRTEGPKAPDLQESREQLPPRRHCVPPTWRRAGGRRPEAKATKQKQTTIRSVTSVELPEGPCNSVNMCKPLAWKGLLLYPYFGAYVCTTYSRNLDPLFGIDDYLFVLDCLAWSHFVRWMFLYIGCCFLWVSL